MTSRIGIIGFGNIARAIITPLLDKKLINPEDVFCLVNSKKSLDNNGIIKLLAHETEMDIPIFNSIYNNSKNITYDTKYINLKKINNLNLAKPNYAKFKTLKILKLLSYESNNFIHFQQKH